MVKNIAIIPARCGSKRVKDKNIADFMGKPMIAYTIEAALNCGVFQDVIVSTDSQQYANIALKYGAKVPFLREQCNDDKSTLIDVMAYVIKKLKEQYGLQYDNYASLQVTCPLRNAQIIKNVYDEFIKTNVNSISTCFEFNFMNPWWAFKMTETNGADFILSSPVKSRSQDNKKLYCPTGAVFFGKIPSNIDDLKQRNVIERYIPIDWKYAVDIDNQEDIDFAKAIYTMIKQQNNK